MTPGADGSASMFQRLADALPKGPVDLGEGEMAWPTLYLGFDQGDGTWELEWCALDGARNFTVTNPSLDAVLQIATAKVEASR